MAKIGVAPRAGAWIEIFIYIASTKCRQSLPARERGLKFFMAFCVLVKKFVAPRAGAWIEIVALSFVPFVNLVAPRAGAWIEIHRVALCSS